MRPRGHVEGHGTAAADRPAHDWLVAITGSGHHLTDATAVLEQLRDAEDRAERAEQRVVALERALVSPPAVERATGLVMGVLGLSADAAADVLTRAARNGATTVVDLAADLLGRVGSLDLDARVRDRLTALLAEVAGVGARHGAAASPSVPPAATVTALPPRR